MKKGVLVLMSIFGVILFTSCEPTNLSDEENVEFHSTDKKDSVNSGGGTNPPVNNDED